MIITKITAEHDRARIKRFVESHEPLCVGLSMQLHTESSAGRTFYAYEEDNVIHGVICLMATHMMFHLVPDPQILLSVSCSHLFAESIPYCISGTAESGQAIEQHIRDMWDISPECSWNYHLMEYEQSTAESADAYLLDDRFTVRQGNPADSNALFPLREAYEIAEVLPPGQPHNKKGCNAAIHRILSDPRTMTVWDKETPAAIACINADGIYWNQIGGVFTAPQYRNNGIARFMVHHLAEQNARDGKRTVLFVKTINAPALAAYQKAGFTTTGSYRLSYYW